MERLIIRRVLLSVITLNLGGQLCRLEVKTHALSLAIVWVAIVNKLRGMVWGLVDFAGAKKMSVADAAIMPTAFLYNTYVHVYLCVHLYEDLWCMYVCMYIGVSDRLFVVFFH